MIMSDFDETIDDYITPDDHEHRGRNWALLESSQIDKKTRTISIFHVLSGDCPRSFSYTIDLRDEMVRDGLVELGWTPPVEKVTHE